MSCGDLFLGVIAILFPPLAVWVKTGLCSAESCINILLCILGYIPGLIHAWYIIAKYPEHDYEHIHDAERQDRVTYYVISHEQSGRHGRQNRHEQRHHGGHGYGTVHGNKQSSHHNSHHHGHHDHHVDHHHHHHHQQFQYAPPQHAPSYQPQQQQSTGVVRIESAPSGSRPAPSSSSNVQGAPPSYNEAIRGDNKIQSRD